MLGRDFAFVYSVNRSLYRFSQTKRFLNSIQAEMSSPTDKEVHRYIQEIVNGDKAIRRRLEKDVRAMCEMLSQLLKDFYQKAPNERDLAQRLKRSLKDIYGSLKLHLKFHLGNAVEITELNTLGEEIGLTIEEQHALPGIECAIDPGSKILEIVSIILQCLSLCFSVKLGKYRTFSDRVDNFLVIRTGLSYSSIRLFFRCKC